MTSRDAANLNAALAAVAEPSRRVILQRLAHGPATTGQLADLSPSSRPATSQHIKVLQTAGLITTTVVGRHSWHQLETEPLEQIAAWANRTASAGKQAPPLRLESDDRPHSASGRHPRSASGDLPSPEPGSHPRSERGGRPRSSSGDGPRSKPSDPPHSEPGDRGPSDSDDRGRSDSGDRRKGTHR